MLTQKIILINLNSVVDSGNRDITDFKIKLPILDKIMEQFPNLTLFYIYANQDRFLEVDAQCKMRAIETFCQWYINRLVTDNEDLYRFTAFKCSYSDNKKSTEELINELIPDYMEFDKKDIIIIDNCTYKEYTYITPKDLLKL